MALHGTIDWIEVDDLEMNCVTFVGNLEELVPRETNDSSYCVDCFESCYSRARNGSVASGKYLKCYPSSLYQQLIEFVEK